MIGIATVRHSLLKRYNARARVRVVLIESTTVIFSLLIIYILLPCVLRVINAHTVVYRNVLNGAAVMINCLMVW